MTDVRAPRIGGPDEQPPRLDPARLIGALLPDYAVVLGAFGTAAMRQQGLSPSTLELARLRNATRMDCRLCMNLRRRSALDDGLDEAVVAQLGDTDASAITGVTDAERTALQLVDAYLWSPGEVPDEVIDRVRRDLTPSQRAQLVLSLVVWTGNRVLVSLGLDAPVDAHRLTMFDYLPSGAQQYSQYDASDESTD
ncbi:MAG TPA: hypothetical protein VGM78_15875 [Ilumatobacteraceae bacterium]